MSQCVPSWDLEDPPNPSPHQLPSSSDHLQVPRADYEVAAELTWENGHVAAHSLGHHRIGKPVAKYPTVTTGTLESVVNQAKLFLPSSWVSSDHNNNRNHHNHHHLLPGVDALVPSATATRRRPRNDVASKIGSCDGGGANKHKPRKKAKLAEGGGSLDSTRVAETCATDEEFGFTTTNSATLFTEDDGRGAGSPDTAGNTSFAGGGNMRQGIEEHDSVCHSHRSQSQREVMGEEDEKLTNVETMRSAISNKRSRAAAVHNQSERRRRDRINQRMRTLQKLVPNSNKTDKASMLDEVIDYLKQLQAQIQMMNRMNSMSPMMMPMGMQQFQMAMMAQMAQMTQMAQMGMGMGMMDMSSLGRVGHVAIPAPVVPNSAFHPKVSGPWEPSITDRMQQPSSVMPDPMSAFPPCPTQQPMTMDAYQRMAGLYQQMFQLNPSTNPK